MEQGLFYDGRSAAAHPVSVVAVPDALEIRDGTGVLLCSWPQRDIRRIDSDAPGNGATLRLAGQAERLVLQDTETLGVLGAAGAPLGRGRRARSAMLFGSALLASTVLAALLVDRLPGLVAPLVPHRMAVAWSDVTEAGLSSGHRRCMAPRGQAALSALVAQLATAAGLAETPAVIVLDSAQVNAFSLPDGRIVVLRGLIRTAEDPDELAGVLAHELGHVRHGDATREALRAAGLRFLADSLGWEGALVGHVTTLSYSRQAEAAADQSALETLRAAGLRADGLGRFIARLGGDAVPAFLSDHPGNADRAAALRVSPNGRAALTPESWAAVKGLCTSAPAATAPALLPL